VTDRVTSPKKGIYMEKQLELLDLLTMDEISPASKHRAAVDMLIEMAEARIEGTVNPYTAEETERVLDFLADEELKNADKL